MKQTYFNAIALRDKPFISWKSVGSFTPAEFAVSEYADDPLVIPEDEVPFPYNVFGVCPKKIVSGVLEDRTPSEMAVFEAEFTIASTIGGNRNKIQTVEKSYFTYDGKNFPMDEASRLFYACIDKLRDDHHILTILGEDYFLINEDTNIDDFILAYYTKLLLLTKHDI